jgi:hypothetical protein
MLLLEVADCCRLIRRFAFTDSAVLLTWGPFASICGLLRLQNGKQTARFRNLSSSVATAPLWYSAPKFFCGEPSACRDTCPWLFQKFLQPRRAREDQTLYIIIVNGRDQDRNGLAVASDDNRAFRLGLFNISAQSGFDVS